MIASAANADTHTILRRKLKVRVRVDRTNRRAIMAFMILLIYRRKWTTCLPDIVREYNVPSLPNRLEAGYCPFSQPVSRL
jgi:hypothetical protein